MNLFELDFNEIDEGVFVADSNGTYIHVNSTGAAILGYAVDEIVGMSIINVIFEKDYEKLQNHFELMNEGQRIFEEFDMKRKDGEKIIAELSARKLADGNYLAVLRDVTSKKVLESKIVEQKENLERLLNTVPSAVYTVDNKKIVTGWNKRAEILTGYSESEVLGKECMLFACEPCIIKCGLLANDVQKPVINRICTIRAKNGEMRQISKNVEAIYDKNGDIVGGIECFEDVTEKLKAEKKLKESQENFHNFFNTIDDMFVVATPEGKILYINRAFSDKLGYNLEELLDMHVLDVHPKEYRSEAEHIFEAMFNGERDFCPLPLQKKDGCYLPVETRVWFGKWDGVDCIYGISKDLSKQQAALEKFHKLFDNNPALMAVSSLPERKFIDVNTSFLEKLGYSKEEIIGKSSGELNLFIEKDKQLKVTELLKEQGNIRNIELKVRKKDGQLMTGLFSGEIIDNQIEKAFLTVMTDITEQKMLRTN